MFRRLWALLRHRERAARTFVSMGLGIERRTRELGLYWGPHLEESKRAQRDWDASGGSVAVLGAGRLADVDSSSLAARFDRVVLADGDPLVAPVWDRLNVGVPVEQRLCDLSGVMGAWRQELEDHEEPWVETLARIGTLHGRAVPPVDVGADHLISLNLLSQIPILWQDVLEGLLERRFGGGWVRKRESEWLEAFEPGARWLVEEHLRLLGRAAGQVLLISDVEYFNYSGGARYSRGRWSDPPVRWRQGQWEPAAGRRGEVTPALYGFDLEDPAALAACMPNHRVAWSRCWLWHIEPLGVECAECGKAHRVAALALARRS